LDFWKFKTVFMVIITYIIYFPLIVCLGFWSSRNKLRNGWSSEQMKRVLEACGRLGQLCEQNFLHFGF